MVPKGPYRYSAIYDFGVYECFVMALGPLGSEKNPSRIEVLLVLTAMISCPDSPYATYYLLYAIYYILYIYIHHILYTVGYSVSKEFWDSQTISAMGLSDLISQGVEQRAGFWRPILMSPQVGICREPQLHAPCRGTLGSGAYHHVGISMAHTDVWEGVASM